MKRRLTKHTLSKIKLQHALNEIRPTTILFTHYGHIEQIKKYNNGLYFVSLLTTKDNGDIGIWKNEDEHIAYVSALKDETFIKAPRDCSSLFAQDNYLTWKTETKFIDVTWLDVANTTNFSNMFYLMGSSASRFTLTGLCNFDMHNAIWIDSMFAYCARAANYVSIKGFEKWNLSPEKIFFMSDMFLYTGECSGCTFNLSRWNWLKQYKGHYEIQNIADASTSLFRIKLPEGLEK